MGVRVNRVTRRVRGMEIQPNVVRVMPKNLESRPSARRPSSKKTMNELKAGLLDARASSASLPRRKPPNLAEI